MISIFFRFSYILHSKSKLTLLISKLNLYKFLLKPISGFEAYKLRAPLKMQLRQKVLGPPENIPYFPKKKKNVVFVFAI